MEPESTPDNVQFFSVQGMRLVERFEQVSFGRRGHYRKRSVVEAHLFGPPLLEVSVSWLPRLPPSSWRWCSSWGPVPPRSPASRSARRPLRVSSCQRNRGGRCRQCASARSCSPLGWRLAEGPAALHLEAVGREWKSARHARGRDLSVKPLSVETDGV